MATYDTEGETCCICMSGLDDEPRHTLGCGHTFHTECILSWAQSDSEAHGNCPVCRFQNGNTDFQTSTTTPFFNYWDKSKFDRQSRIIQSSLSHMDQQERAVYALLQKEVEKTQGRLNDTNEAMRNHRRANKDIFKQMTKLDRANRIARQKAHEARRTLISQFPVTNIVVFREEPRRRRAINVLRRSSRIASAVATDDPMEDPD